MATVQMIPVVQLVITPGESSRCDRAPSSPLESYSCGFLHSHSQRASMVDHVRATFAKTSLASPTRSLLDRSTESTDAQSSDNVYRERWTQRIHAILFGMINAIIIVPALYGFTVILFSHKDFETFLPVLSKLVIFSSLVHQMMFTCLSSLRFSIGQVQDAGLIILSTMATSICNSLGTDVPLEAKVTTSVVTIGIATAALGVCLVIMGKVKLAALASYLPMPVIGGYLSFIGLFCLYAGFALCTGRTVTDYQSMIKVLANAHDVLLCVPGALGGMFLFLVSQRYNSFVLSGAIVLLPLLFFFIMFVGGMSLQDVRDDGWIAPAKEDPATVSQLVKIFNFSLVHWSEVPKQIGTWIGLVFIVAFSSCLDVAAIEINLGSKLDFNHELQTVGWSNIVSGLLGGYTGSYIFSQTVFTMQSKTNSRIVGVCVILIEFAIVVAPVSIMSYVPRFFFAATLFFIAMSLLLEWLVLSCQKMSLREYAVLWTTFLAVNLVALDRGMLIGLGIAILNFLLGYIHVPVVHRQSRASRAARTLAERRALHEKSNAIVLFEFMGFLFFGSSVQILSHVQSAVYVHKKRPEVAGGTNYVRDTNVFLTPEEHRLARLECLDGTPAVHPDAVPTEYVVMDFTNVTAMDATVARSAFLFLQNYCTNHKILVVYAGASPKIVQLLKQTDITDDERIFSSADAALEFCENMVVATYDGAVRRSSQSDEFTRQFPLGESEALPFWTGANEYFERRNVSAGHEFYRSREPADCFYFLASGCITLERSHGVDQSVMPGSLFGDVEFFGRQERRARAVATERSTVFEMRRENYIFMQEQNSILCARVCHIVMESMALSLCNGTTYENVRSLDI
ncbi:hypothetical protein PsorP6_009441 [Peronosclerospora sorghi]|uniref:Uncharacterized protein n=1 Tax=Peronosclerospora sorghi TaxID=230839 RepID=A0ACC0VX97_9STRA|nr:hypothetical protein PsorP6_009441 [Peronosclerospora sorghi]